MSESSDDPRHVIERVVWRYGVTGDSCALLTAAILDALDSAGWLIAPKENSGS